MQVCDALPVAADTSRMGLLDEALHGRLLPAQGALPIDELLSALPGVPLSSEIRSAALCDRHADATDRARAVWTATERYRNDG